MEYLLVAGLFVWISMAFLGSRNAFLHGRPAPLSAQLRTLKSNHAGFMYPLAALAVAGAALLVFQEVASVRAQAGAVGLRFGLAVLAGGAGAVLFSARLYLRLDD